MNKTARWCVLGLMTFSLVATAAAHGGSKTAAGKKSSAIPPGKWGGEHVSMEVTASGAQLEFDCAHGQITGPIQPDRNGKFDAAGTFSAEHAGPILRDEGNSTPPTHYSGQVNGDTIVLTITLADAPKPLGTYTLKKGAEPRLMKCR